MTGMQLSQLPERTQDYLKILWNHEERHGSEAAMALGELAKAAEQKLPTASEAVKRLATQDLVIHERYSGVRLAPLGRHLAVGVVRRHRLVETFLVETLGYSWDEVHAEADVLEHACSDRFVERLDALLGHPTRDPHGDPIPGADGTAEALSELLLADAPLNTPVTVEQVNDADPDLLRLLDRHGVYPGVQLVIPAPAAAGLLEIDLVDGGRFTLAEVAARDITVRV